MLSNFILILLNGLFSYSVSLFKEGRPIMQGRAGNMIDDNYPKRMNDYKSKSHYKVERVKIKNNLSDPFMGKKVIGYLPSWSIYNTNFNFTTIPYQNLTHLVYSFALVTEKKQLYFDDAHAAFHAVFKPYGNSTECTGLLNYFKSLKQLYPHLKTVLSIGGNHYLKTFSNVRTDKDIYTFLTSLHFYMNTYRFDGVDLSFGDNDDSKLMFTMNKLIQQIDYSLNIDSLKNTRKKKDVIVTFLPNDSNYGNTFLLKFDRNVAYWNVLCYNLDTVKGLKPQFFSALFSPHGSSESSCHHLVSMLMELGVDSEKILIGIPLFGKKFRVDLERNQQNYTTESYTFLGENYVNEIDDSGNNITSHFYMPQNVTKSTHFFTVKDSLSSIYLKNHYVQKFRLGGVSFWNLLGDFKNANQSLVQNFVRYLGNN